MTIYFKLLNENAKMPFYATKGSVGMDISASEAVTILPGAVRLVKTGLAVQLPLSVELQVRPRSGLAAKQSVTVLNSPGTIDSDYRGEICVILINHGSHPVNINQGDRIAQIVPALVLRTVIARVEGDLPTTERGSGGFGSTGIS